MKYVVNDRYDWSVASDHAGQTTFRKDAQTVYIVMDSALGKLAASDPVIKSYTVRSVWYRKVTCKKTGSTWKCEHLGGRFKTSPTLGGKEIDWGGDEYLFMTRRKDDLELEHFHDKNKGYFWKLNNE